MARSLLAFSQVRFDFRIGSLFSSLCSLVVCFRDFPFVLWWIRRVGWWWFGSERILADFGEADSSVVDRFLVVTHTEAPLLRRADPLAPLLLFFWFDDRENLWFKLLSGGKIFSLSMRWWVNKRLRQWWPLRSPWAVKPKNDFSFHWALFYLQNMNILLVLSVLRSNYLPCLWRWFWTPCSDDFACRLKISHEGRIILEFWYKWHMNFNESATPDTNF